jgi:threonine dehydratase
MKTCRKHGSIFIPPFDDDLIISGQGTIAMEIYKDLKNVDVILCPIGGGGLIAGVLTYYNYKSPATEIIGVESEGATAMYESLKNHRVVTLKTVDTFVDGAAVKRVGIKTFKIVNKLIKRIIIIPVGQICSTMIELYQEEGIITEPAGAMSVASLDFITDSIKDKTVVCIISGGNNDLMRYPEIIEKSLAYKKHNPSFS